MNVNACRNLHAKSETRWKLFRIDFIYSLSPNVKINWNESQVKRRLKSSRLHICVCFLYLRIPLEKNDVKC